MKSRITTQIITTLLCVVVIMCFTPGIAFATPEANVAPEVENTVAFKTLNKMQTVPVDFSTISETGKEVTIHVNPNIQGEVDGNMVSEIIESSPVKSGDRISINNVGYPEQRSKAPAVDFDNYYNTTYSYGTTRVSHDKFVISVAKGAQKKLESTWSFTVKGGFEGSVSLYDIASVTAKLAGSVTCTYKTTYVFKGPAEGSKYNSREFRVKYYKQKVTVTQTDPVSKIKKTSKYDRAVKYAEYSIDSKIV